MASIHAGNKTNIILVPKVKNPSSMSNYRPINLCNLKYKLVTKVLANKLKIILDKFISQAQSAFILGRTITDNIMVGHESLHLIDNRQSRNQGIAAVKLDISKTYDRVEWPFLRNMMVQLGFTRKLIDIIMNCLTIVHFSVIIKGEPRESFSSSRRSPYLFLIIIEGLSYLVKVANNKGTLKGIDFPNDGPLALTSLMMVLVFTTSFLLMITSFSTKWTSGTCQI